MLVNTIGGLLILEAVFMVIPLVTALIYEEKDWEAFAFTAAFTALSGILMRRIPVRSNRMGKREGFILTASVWIFFSLFGMIPFIISNTPVSISSAFFEGNVGVHDNGGDFCDHTDNGVEPWYNNMAGSDAMAGRYGYNNFTLCCGSGLEQLRWYAHVQCRSHRCDT